MKRGAPNEVLVLRPLTIARGYQQARLQYAPERVAHLGAELQEHYKRKAEAVDRAYRILTE